MTALAPSELSFLEGLPLPVREEATNWEAALAAVTNPIGQALEGLAIRFGCDYVTARRKWDAWRKHGLRGLVNCRKAGITRAALLRSGGLESVANCAVYRNPDFCAYCKQLAERYQRKTLPAHRAFARQWRNGATIPGLDNTLPRHELPPGCGRDNFYRIVKDAFALAATRRGLGYAVGKYGPMNFTTRANLWYGSHYPIDDVWHDNFVVFGHERSSQLVRVLQLGGMDVFTGSYIAWGCKPRIERADGTMDNLKEKYARLIVCKILFQEGYSPRGTEFLAEHGTAAISEFLERLMRQYGGVLPGTDKAVVSVRRSGITGAEQAVMGWTGQGKGNPRHKSWLESFHNLIHNELAALPAQTGKDRDSRPEYTNKMLSECADELKVMAVLAQKNPQRAAQMRLRLLNYHSDFLPVLMDVYRGLNERTWHKLEGWDNIPGNRVVEYRTAPTSDHWLTNADFAVLPPESQNLIISLAQADPRYIQSRRLSPAEVRRREMRAAPLLKFPAFAIAEMLGPDFGRELEVKGAYFRTFSDEELSTEPLRYESVVKDSEGREQQLKDDRYLIFINPFDLSVIFVHDAAKRFLGTARLAGRFDMADPQQVKASLGRTAHRLAELKQPIMQRHAETARAEVNRLAHNAAVMDEAQPYTPDEIERSEFVSREGAAAADDILAPAERAENDLGNAGSELLSALTREDNT